MNEVRHDAECPFKYPPSQQRSHLGGIQHIFQFENGRGASVIQNWGSYGNEKGLWELAVLRADGSLDYTTEISTDVIGYLSVEEVDVLLDKISDLPSEEES